MNVAQTLSCHTVGSTTGSLCGALLRTGEGRADNVTQEEPALPVWNRRKPVPDPVAVSCAPERSLVRGAAAFASRSPLTKTFAKSVASMPVEVFGVEKSGKGRGAGAKCQKEGEPAGAFPGCVHTAPGPHAVFKTTTSRTGFSRVALQAKLPVIPFMAIGPGERNMHRVPPRPCKMFFYHPRFQQGVRWLHDRWIRVRIGKPSDPYRFNYRDFDRTATDRIRGRITFITSSSTTVMMTTVL